MNGKRAMIFIGFIAVLLYGLLLVEVRRYRDGSDWFFFIHLTKKILYGDPLSIYSEKEYGTYSYYYSPVSLYLLSPVVYLSDRMNLAPVYQQIVNVIPFAVFDLLMAWGVVAVVKLYRKIDWDEALAMFVFGLFLFVTLFSSLYSGRFESAFIFLLLMGFRSLVNKKWNQAAVLMTLSVLVKQTALLAMVPILAVLFVRNKRVLGKMIGVMILLSALVMLPYWLKDPAAVRSAFSGQFVQEIKGFTIWHAIGKIPGGFYLLKWNLWLILSWQLLIMYLTIKIKPKLKSIELLTLITLGVVGTFALMNVVLSYYLLYPLIFIYIWERSRGSAPVLTYLYMGAGLMIHTMGMSRETMMFVPGLLTSMIVLVTNLGVLIYLASHLPRLTDKDRL